MISRKRFVVLSAALAFGLAAVPGVKAGGDEVVTEERQAPQYNDAPPREPIYEGRVVYYPPPVVTVGFYPGFGFYGRPFGYYHRYPHYYRGHGHWRGRYWR